MHGEGCPDSWSARVSPVASDNPSDGQEALPHGEGRSACGTIKPNTFASRRHVNRSHYPPFSRQAFDGSIAAEDCPRCLSIRPGEKSPSFFTPSSAPQSEVLTPETQKILLISPDLLTFHLPFGSMDRGGADCPSLPLSCPSWVEQRPSSALKASVAADQAGRRGRGPAGDQAGAGLRL